MNDVDGRTSSMIDAMWRSVYGKIRLAIRQELLRYKPRVADLGDTGIGTLTDNDMLKWSTAAKRWVNGAGFSSGDALHSAHFSLPLPFMVIPPGPKNKTGENEYVFAVNIVSDGAATVSCTGHGSITFPEGGGESDIDLDATENLQTVAPDARLWVSVDPDSGLDGNYVAVSWGIRGGTATVSPSAQYGGVT